MKLEGIFSGLNLSLSEKNEALYKLPLGSESLSLNELIGQKISLELLGKIQCRFCCKTIKKSFANGSCYKCFMELPQNDLCVLKPETCHFHKGSCRKSEWGEDNCFQTHFIYLAQTSGLKVGITRHFRLPTRWIEQGATKAVTLATVSNRIQAGLAEVFLKKFVADKTNWRKMLSPAEDLADFSKKKQELTESLLSKFNFTRATKQEPLNITYPVLGYPEKVVSHNLEKNPSA